MKVPFIHRLPLSSAWRRRRLFSSRSPLYILDFLYKKVPSAIFLVQQAFFPPLLWEGDLPTSSALWRRRRPPHPRFAPEFGKQKQKNESEQTRAWYLGVCLDKKTQTLRK